MSRETDLRMLREVLEFKTLDNDTRIAFEDMLESLGVRRELSEKQRAWLAKILDVPTYSNDVSSGRVSRVVKHNHPERAICDGACPAWTPPALRNLPLKPPGRPR